VPIDKVYYTWKLEIMKEEAQKWIAACERDPNEEYILQLIGITFHEESYISVSRWKKHYDLLTYLQVVEQGDTVDRKRIVRRIARGLEILHDINSPTPHGHLRASNIMVNDNGEPLLGGFGMSKLLKIIIDPGRAEAQELDSFRWLAPELHATGGDDSDDSDDNDSDSDADKDGNNNDNENGDSDRSSSGSDSDEGESKPMASDIFSLAMTIFEVMTGDRPFKNDESPLSVRGKIGNGLRPKRPKKGSSAVRRGLDDRLWDLITRCWAQDPKDRPDIFEVSEELDKMWPDIKLS